MTYDRGKEKDRGKEIKKFPPIEVDLDTVQVCFRHAGGQQTNRRCNII